ncbi:hypothetical protein fHeYen902_229 [Yersinia phage fHe-Yen9-02]|nr:hypothetical protein fHeYen902_229 [Yersinia phage fHe-Yen9-02]
MHTLYIGLTSDRLPTDDNIRIDQSPTLQISG